MSPDKFLSTPQVARASDVERFEEQLEQARGALDGLSARLADEEMSTRDAVALAKFRAEYAAQVADLEASLERIRNRVN